MPSLRTTILRGLQRVPDAGGPVLPFTGTRIDRNDAITLPIQDVDRGAPDPASEAAMRAALAVGMGIADRGVLPSAPAAAVESVMMASIDCGFELAMRWAQDKSAAAVRSVLGWDAIAACVAALEDRR